MTLRFHFRLRNGPTKQPVAKSDRVANAMIERLEGRTLLSADPTACGAALATRPVADSVIASPQTSDRRAQHGRNRIEANNTSVSSQDIQWMNDAASGNLLEIMLGNAAQTQGSAPIVQAFGERMVQDHSLTDLTLRQIATTFDVMLPTTLNSADQQTFDQIANLSGNEFDQAYANFMVQHHEEEIVSFTQEAIRTNNPTLRAFANQTLPVLQMHLMLARIMDATVNGDNQLSDQDREWMMDAASGNLLEIMLGTVALDQASSGAVKAFGARMVQDHSLADQTLRQIADTLGVTLPTTLNPEDQQTFDRISSLEGTAFDQAYASTMVQDHQEDITSYTNEATSTTSDALRTFANQNIPILQFHLALAEQLDAMVQTNTMTNGNARI